MATDIERQKQQDQQQQPVAKKIKYNESVYDNIPSLVDIDRYIPVNAYNELLPCIAKEFSVLNIQTIVKMYEPVVSEFLEIANNYRKYSEAYNKLLHNFINTLCQVYNIQLVPMYVSIGKYTTTEWGNIYWKFLHLSSILVTYAYENKYIKSMLYFPTIVYNIDLILPCPKCIGHYYAVKESDNVRNCIKDMSFGALVRGLIDFHNIITDNVDKTPEYQQRPKRRPFINADFARVYKCIDMPDERLQKTTTYITGNIDMQSETHNLITIILSYYLQQSYSRVSSLIKRHIYNEDVAFAQQKITKQYNIARHFTEDDVRFSNLTKSQLLYCLMRALLLQFQDTSITPEQLKNNNLLSSAILKMYRKYPKVIREMLEFNARTIPDDKRQHILSKLKSLETIDIDTLNDDLYITTSS